MKREHITATFPNVNELVGHSLFVAVSVLTESGKKETVSTCSVCLIMCESHDLTAVFKLILNEFPTQERKKIIISTKVSQKLNGYTAFLCQLVMNKTNMYKFFSN